ncbi:hypothetical protein Gpo141_00009611 [Globisporangium polare]
MASSMSSSSSSSNDTVSTAAPTAATTPTLRTSAPAASSSDTCGCRASGSPRSCYECLNTKLLGGDSCVVTPLGLCMSTSSAASMQSFFNSTFALCATSRNCSIVEHSNQYFYSASAVYCEASDAKCASCRANWISAYQSDLLRNTTKFSCTGTGGCVCTAYCELRDASSVTLPSALDTGGEYCSSDGSSGSQSSGMNMNTIMNSIAFVGAAIMLAVMLRSGITQFRQREYQLNMAASRRAEQIERVAARRARPALSLEGWNSYREQLIGREQQHLGLKTESIFSEAPSRAIVEEGEGFRPASPSQIGAQSSVHGP